VLERARFKVGGKIDSEQKFSGQNPRLGYDQTTGRLSLLPNLKIKGRKCRFLD
jgi:hypothetical protein